MIAKSERDSGDMDFRLFRDAPHGDPVVHAENDLPQRRFEEEPILKLERV